MKKTVITLVVGFLPGAGAMYIAFTRATYQIMDMYQTLDFSNAVFGLEFYRRYGPERIEWFLEHEVKCRAELTRSMRENLSKEVPGWIYKPEFPMKGETIKKARELVGSELDCGSSDEA